MQFYLSYWSGLKIPEVSMQQKVDDNGLHFQAWQGRDLYCFAMLSRPFPQPSVTDFQRGQLFIHRAGRFYYRNNISSMLGDVHCDVVLGKKTQNTPLNNSPDW